MPDHVVEFDLHEDSLLELKKAGAVLQLEDLSISSDDGVVVGKVFDKSDPTSNNYSIELGDLSGGKKFDFHFKLENLRFLPGDYTCQITEKVVSRFASVNDDLEYYVALESTSNYEG